MGRKLDINLMKSCFLFVLFTTCCACTLNFNLITTCTHGYANDVVDDTNKDEVEAELSVPLKGI